ncbi:Hypothetical protein A7982_10873 [Minicystis rosea]|nr:Hypothetical protein A7982_10873 [Minicystis rosea]
MASQSKHTGRWQATLSATALVAIFGAALAAGPSGCFLSSNGLGTGTGGGGGTGGTTSSATTTSSTTTATGSTTSSTTSSSSSGGVCTVAADCGNDTDCATWSCVSGNCQSTPVQKGMPCIDKSGVCDPNGACVGCFVDGTTTFGCGNGFMCVGGTCASCTNGAKDGDETDVDCGGSCGKTCGLTKGCTSVNDCAAPATECTNGKCTACNDGTKNGDESGVDCGGSCGKCDNGKSCGGNGDCTSGACVSGICCNMACSGSCASCTLPQHEGTCTVIPSGLDGTPTCGGGKVCDGAGACQNLAAKKAVGQTCATNVECFNGNCAAGYCKFKNGDACTWNMECSSGLCAQGQCKACATTPDCGPNSACNAGVCNLPPGSFCAAAADCFENACNFGYCTLLHNPGGSCLGQGDCFSHLCSSSNVCVSCTTADCASCSGGNCLAPAGAACRTNNDCDSKQCTGTPFKRCQ